LPAAAKSGALALVVSSPSGPTGQQNPQFRSGVEVIFIDVNVID